MWVGLRSRSYRRDLATLAVLGAVAACGGGGGGEPTGPDRNVTQVAVTPATPSVIAGQNVTLTAQPRNAAGEAVSGQTVVWSSSDVSVATVANGVVTAVKPGGVTITATAGSVPGSTTVTVIPAVANVAVTPSPAEVTAGGTVRLTASLTDAAGTPITGRTVAWSSSSDAAATVAADGTVTGKVVGAVLITATIEGKTGSATVNVRPVPVASVTVSPNPLTLPFGATQSLTYDAKDAAGNSLGGRAVSWTSDNPLVATVSTTGAITTRGVGPTTVRATVEGKVGTTTVNVTGEPAASVTVTPSPTTVEAGQTTTLTPTVKDGSGTTLNGRAVAWTTSDAAKATVNDGVVTGKAVGTVTITATTSEGKSGTATVNVADTQDPVLRSLTIEPSTVNVASGPKSVVVSARLTDGSGIARFDVRAASPVVGAPAQSCIVTTPSSGTVNDGVFSCAITLPQGAASGDWILTIGALDSSPAGRSVIITSSGLANMGITPSRITVQ
jgi:uncharacterized protein YjdB